MDYNKVILIGRLTRKPEMRHTASGTAITGMCVAVNRRIGKDDKQDVTYIDVNAWGKTAEFCERYFDKGSPILIEGRLTLEKWTDKQGQSRSALKVTAETVAFAESKNNSDNRNGGGNRGGYGNQQGNYRGNGGDYNTQNNTRNTHGGNERYEPRQSYQKASNSAYNAPQNMNGSEHRYSPEDEPQAAAPTQNQPQTEMNDDIPF